MRNLKATDSNIKKYLHHCKEVSVIEEAQDYKIVEYVRGGGPGAEHGIALIRGETCVNVNKVADARRWKRIKETKMATAEYVNYVKSVVWGM